MKLTTLGIDLAKSIFRLHGVDARGVAVLRRQLTRQQLLPFLAKLSPCLVGMEAGPGAHFWAREIGKLGHVVRLMSPHFVKPYVKSNKNEPPYSFGLQILGHRFFCCLQIFHATNIHVRWKIHGHLNMKEH